MADDPTWTADQVAAVHIVDAYIEVATRLFSDPASANTGDWNTVSTDPQRASDVDTTLKNMARGWTSTGSPMAIATRRSVSPEETVDGRREIHVVQCQVDNPDYHVFINGDPYAIPGSHETTYDFTVQWVEDQQGWRVAARRQTSPTC